MPQGGVCVDRHEGTPQGGPLSPLPANLLLDDLDQELEKRGHRFCRYERVRAITRRNRGRRFDAIIDDLNRFTRGWVNYFRLAEAKTHLARRDEWLRSRLRCYRLK